MRRIKIYDSTLRDGAQAGDISFSVEDKLSIARMLDKIGVDYIEAGNPGSNPKDIEFFGRRGELGLQNARLAAFGATRKPGVRVSDDKNIAALAAAGTDAVCIFGKSWNLQVTDILMTSLRENLNMISDTVTFFKECGKEVIFDAEHFFDGYKADKDYALASIEAAIKAGADSIVLCDTAGGSFPDEIYDITKFVCGRYDTEIGIHCHNDTECAAANSIMAVKAGAVQVQGTFIGFGERCGNANLSSVIPSLQLKRGFLCIPHDNMSLMTGTARYIAECANITLPNNLSYVGKNAFAHKGGMHVDAVDKNPASFEHITPESVGNKRGILLSEVSGRTAVLRTLQQFDPTLKKDSPETDRLTTLLKDSEHQGYQYEAAAASLELIVLKELGRVKNYYEIEDFNVCVSKPQDGKSSSATVSIRVGGSIRTASGEGNGPVDALDIALRKSVMQFYPAINEMKLIDYKVRVLDSVCGTASKVRVLIESTDGSGTWTTIGVSSDIINASLQALNDSIEYKLIKPNISSAPL
ncbi:MAG: citramalate synthase [Oscillospiraceae bacterium]|nr:citramalate synthase [Oscillospiraceae bacterium]